MGLDMYLFGETLPSSDREPTTTEPSQIEPSIHELGYWRKHGHLHDFILTTFAGRDEKCRQIELSADDLRKIIAAVEVDEPRHTTRSYFGTVNGTDHEEDYVIFRKALEWLEAEESDVRKSVAYYGSW